MLDSLLTYFEIVEQVWIAIPWHWVVVVLHSVLAPLSAAHAMLFKRDSRAALGWVIVCLFFPVIGPLSYYVFGINRIQTQAKRLISEELFGIHIGYERGNIGAPSSTKLFPEHPSKQFFSKVSDRLTSNPLTPGNSVNLLCNGEQAYPAMVEAIASAKHYIYLVTYIFETDVIGREIIGALAAACKRGVDIKVIVDGIGEKYSWPRARRLLRRAGIDVVQFLPPKLLPPTLFINLRNHRKVIIVDGIWGFTGGMNIGGRHLVENNTKNPTADIHFSIKGPVVNQLQVAFENDWRFITRQELQHQPIAVDDNGDTHCRCISDGPDKDLDKISLSLKTAIATARVEVIIMTPYFLPSREMIAVLQTASLRGVKITVVLPQKTNLPFVDWATRNLLWQLLLYDIRVLYQPPPFAHSKLLLVDRLYAQVGSANIDPRSLRLNFELNMELMGERIIQTLGAHVDDIIAKSRAVSLEEADGRPILARLRDAFCWLFLPYL